MLPPQKKEKNGSNPFHAVHSKEGSLFPVDRSMRGVQKALSSVRSQDRRLSFIAIDDSGACISPPFASSQTSFFLL